MRRLPDQAIIINRFIGIIVQISHRELLPCFIDVCDTVPGKNLDTFFCKSSGWRITILLPSAMTPLMT